MIGVGAIYRDYAAGRLVADDEVAVAHLPAERGYRATSDALVNLRFVIVAELGNPLVDLPPRSENAFEQRLAGGARRGPPQR